MIVSLFTNGISIPKPYKVLVPKNGKGATNAKRGKISGFSSASRLRLRLALLSRFVPGCRRYGITLTLPWAVDDWSLFMGDFREVLHRFRVYWLRAFPRQAAIYRVELQRRGAPHLHLVSFHRADKRLSEKYFLLWFRALLSDLRGGSYSDFARRGVVVDECPNMSGLLRYLCDHTSKKKQAQLGYPGKQWGILGEKNLSSLVPDDYELSTVQYNQLLRFLRKITRFRLSRSARFPSGLPCPFGSKLVGGRSSCRVGYVGRLAVSRFLRSIGAQPKTRPARLCVVPDLFGGVSVSRLNNHSKPV